MKCPEAGTIQSYIDGELDIGMRKDIEIHIAECAKCRNVYGNLKENDDFAFEKLTYYKDKAMGIEDTGEADSRTGHRQSAGLKGAAFPGNSKGVYSFMLKYKKYITAACAVAVLAACISIQPVRAVISDALSIFRVDNFKGLRITPKELSEIRENLSEGQGDFTLDKIGRIKVDGGQMKSVSETELASSCSFPVLYASGLKDVNPEIQLAEPSTISFTLNADNVNTILRSFKAKELLPEEIDGKTFSISFGAIASVNYRVGGKTYEIMETTSPDIQVPEDVDEDSLFNTLASIPVFPDELKTRLSSMKDWKNTLYIPVFQDKDVSIEEVQLNGKTAYVCTNEENSGSSDLKSGVIWMENGAIYGISSNTGKDDILRFAETVK